MAGDSLKVELSCDSASAFLNSAASGESEIAVFFLSRFSSSLGGSVTCGTGGEDLRLDRHRKYLQFALFF